MCHSERSDSAVEESHRTINITDELYAVTKAEIENSIALGCRIFYFGGFSAFDELCYEIVTTIKDERAELNIQRIFCVPMERDLRKKVCWIGDNCYEDVVYLVPSHSRPN